MPKLREESNDAMCFICFSLCVAIHLMDRVDVIVSCMIIREPMSLVGEMQFGSDARDKWACGIFPHCLAPELKADLRDAIREN